MKKNKIDDIRLYVLIGITIIAFIIIIIRIFQLQFLEVDKYQDKLADLTIVTSDDAVSPRGKIYDRNGVVIVDNVAVVKLIYQKGDYSSFKHEKEIALFLAKNIELDYSVTEEDLKKFWIKDNPSLADRLIKEEEWQLLNERKLTTADIEQLKLSRVSGVNIDQYDEISKKAIYIYDLMNEGYSYSDKIIKKNITDYEYALIGVHIDNLSGIKIITDWERNYPYGDVLKTILGTVTDNGLPYELKDYYLDLGYDLNDRVGSSYLEYQYEGYLHGVKAKYQLNADGSKSIISEAKAGNDIQLTIDINLQKEIENIVTEELLYAKKEPNTKYLDSSFVVIQDPNTGEILAMTGKKVKLVDGEYKVYDYTAGIVTSPITPGSIVKGASHIVGYNTGALVFGEVRNDACIKILATPLKCSFTQYGNINDLQALQYSSNTYQFRTAIKVGKATYTYNGPLKIDESAFDIYRNIFGQFGLGVKTEIDLPIESLGFFGTSRQAGLLLDFAIGQYDTYTPIQLSQYISTIANGGNRMQPHLLKGVYETSFKPLTKSIYEFEPKVLNTVETDPKNMERVKQGFKLVFTGGTGRGYIDEAYNPAGKTGTSESFVDSDGDGKIDTETVTATLGAYAPSDNPKVSFVIVSPNMSLNNVSYGAMSKINKRITKKVSQKYFEIYK